MGMSKERMEFQLQQQTQKAIAELTQNMIRLDKVLQIVDGNMRQSHIALLQDITRLTVRVNFLLNELKIGMTEAGATELEARFKAFAESEAAKMQKGIEEVAAKMVEAEAARKAGEPGSENTPNVVQ